MFADFYKIIEFFKNSNFDDPLYETLRVFDVLSNKSISRLDLSTVLKNEEHILSLVNQRSNNVPVEYILGMGSFYGNLFHCEPGALIPRDETELLVNKALDFIKGFTEKEYVNVVDMGTGCGSIAISIALNDVRTNVIASDLNESTIQVAKKNVAKFQLEDRVKLLVGDLFAPFEGQGYNGNIDIVVCNPPYIPTTSLNKMESEIIDYEPKEAFDGGAFGINFYKRLIKDSLPHLKKGGILIFEIGQGQEKLVKRLFKKAEDYQNIQFHYDGEHVRGIRGMK